MGGGKGGTQTVRQELDPRTRAFTGTRYDMAEVNAQQPYTPYQGQTVAGVSTLTPEVIARQQQMANAGLMGMNAMGGDPAAVQQMMNPFFGAMNPVFDRMRADATMAANDAATRAGAFGGSRHGVALGEQLGGVDRAQAQMLYGDFNNAMGRAGQLANLGFGANQQLGTMGDYLRNIQQQGLTDQYQRFLEQRGWQDNRLGILNATAAGSPYGNTQSMNMPSNPLGGAMGGAMAGSAFGPVGMGVGAGLGLLFS